MKINSMPILAAAIVFTALASTSFTADAQSATPGAAPMPRTPPRVATPPRGPAEMGRFATRTGPGSAGGPGSLSGAGGRAHALEPAGRMHCHTTDECNKLVADCDRNKGGMNTNPDGTQTCTVYRDRK